MDIGHTAPIHPFNINNVPANNCAEWNRREKTKKKMSNRNGIASRYVLHSIQHFGIHDEETKGERNDFMDIS